MFEAVIFDWDGTLADTRFAVVTSFQTVLREIGCDVSDEFVERRIGVGTTRTFVEALEARSLSFSDEEIEELVQKKTKLQIELARTVKLFEGASDLLTSLFGRVKLALASMSGRIVIDKLLDEKGIREYFDVVITADDVLEPKPNPEAFLKSAAELQSPPERCVVVEDSIFGVKAAREAGMACVAIPSEAYSKRELEEEGPDLIVDSMKDQEQILNFILHVD